MHFEAAPSLKDDLIFILKHATSCIEPVVGLLETSGVVTAPACRLPGPRFDFNLEGEHHAKIN